MRLAKRAAATGEGRTFWDRLPLSSENYALMLTDSDLERLEALLHSSRGVDDDARDLRAALLAVFSETSNQESGSK